jgi:hypothetical protein
MNFEEEKIRRDKEDSIFTCLCKEVWLQEFGFSIKNDNE